MRRRERRARNHDHAVGYFAIEPEASGWPAAEVAVGAVACVFDTWLGDDVVRAHPAVLVTTPVKRALQRLHEPTGFEIARARIRTSAFFRKHNAGRRLPPFWVLQIGGRPGRDDMGLTAATTLVVSRRVLDVLLEFRIGRAVFMQYAPGERTSSPTSRRPKCCGT